MVTVPHIMVGLKRMLDYRGVRLERFHCNCNNEFILGFILCIIKMADFEH